MEPMFPQPGQSASQPAQPAKKVGVHTTRPKTGLDHYAQAELESRHERIERAIQQAQHRLG